MTCETPSGGEVDAGGSSGANTDVVDTVVDAEFAGLCDANAATSETRSCRAPKSPRLDSDGVACRHDTDAETAEFMIDASSASC